MGVFEYLCLYGLCLLMGFTAYRLSKAAYRLEQTAEKLTPADEEWKCWLCDSPKRSQWTVTADAFDWESIHGPAGEGAQRPTPAPPQPQSKCEQPATSVTLWWENAVGPAPEVRIHRPEASDHCSVDKED